MVIKPTSTFTGQQPDLASIAPLQSVLCTEELYRRPSRSPDYERESRALGSLAQALADSPRTILQALADTILDVFQTGSAGISLVTEDEKRFYWPAIAGAWKPHIGEGTPRDFGPCGDVLDHNGPLLFSRFERRYAYFLPVRPPIEECLLVPFYAGGKAVGTIWAIAHDDRRKFDGEDLRMLVSLGKFASAAFQAVKHLHAFREQAHERKEGQQALREINEALVLGSVRQHELAETAEKLNAQLRMGIAERKQAEERVRRSELRYRRLFEVTRDGILILDPETRKITEANPFIIEFLGYPREQLIGKELWEIGLLKDKDASRKAFLELKRRGFIRYESLPLATKSDQRREVEFISNLYQENGDSVIQCNIRDVTDRKKTEQDLSEKARLLDLSNDAIIVHDLDDRISSWNKGAEELYGWTSEEVMGQHLDSLLQMKFPKPVEEILAQLQSEGHFSGEVAQIARDGRRVAALCRWVLDRGTQSILTSYTDITERKRAERELSEKARLLDLSNDAIIVHDLDDRISLWTKGAEKLYGWTFEEVIGKHLHALLQTEFGKPMEEIVAQLYREGQFNGEVMQIARDGSRVVSLCRKVLDRGTDSILTSYTNISDRKHFEAQREALLANEQASRMEAEAANRSKDLFLATLSHEVRTPLNAILGWATILRNGKCEAAEVKEGMEVIERNCRSQAQLIEDVLDISRIVSGKLRLQIGTCELVDVIKAALDVVRPAADAKGVRIETAIDMAASHSSCDANRMQQVVWNLLTNAIKFTPQGRTVRITLARERSSSRIQVSDEGQGINPDFLPFVFDRFRQADSGTQRKFGGLGLGLSIVKHIVEMHGGTVQAGSDGDGRGATFTVNLPVRAVQLDEENGEAAGEGDTRTLHLAPVRLDDLRVLVVDDEADARRLLIKVLGEAGALVTAAASVADALAVLETSHPQVLLSDIAMPGQDGYELIRQIRGMGLTVKQLPAVALTAFAHKEDRRRALLAGFQVHVAKPIDPHDLTAVIASLAGRTG